MDSPIGRLRIEAEQKAITRIDFHWQLESEEQPLEDDPLVAVVDQIRGYFEKPQPLQSLAVSAAGTPFQQRVWRALCEIPLGQAVTYGALAEQLGSSPRAVGGACRSNPIPLIIPCHRVVAKHGMGGFAGEWGESERVDVKQWLLRHEGYLK